MPVVQMPDGALVDMPETLTPEQKSALEAKLGQGPGPIRRALNSLVAGFGGTAAQMPRALGMVLPLPEEAAKNLNELSGELGAQYEQVGKQGVQGLAGEALKGVGGAMVGGGAAAPVRSAISGAGGGVGAELAARTFGDNGLTRLLGGLAGGFAAGKLAELPGRVRPNTEQLAQTVLKDIGEDKLQKAAAFQAEAKAQGVNIDLSQALSGIGVDAPRVKRLRDFLADHDAGEALQKLLVTQKPELDVLSTTTVGGMPGNVLHRDTAANNLQKAATTRVAEAKAERTALFQKTLEDSIAALKATEAPKLQAAAANVKAAEGSVEAWSRAVSGARAELQGLVANLSKAKLDDAASVAAANEKISRAQALVEQLQNFTLPRGRATGNSGQLLDPTQRGQSIDFDQIARQSQAERLAAQIPSKVAPAPSLATTTAEKALQAGQSKIGQLEAGLAGEQDKLSAALANQRSAESSLRQVTEVPPTVVERQAALLDKVVAGHPNTGIATAVQRLRANLFDKEGLPITDASALDKILRSEGAKLKGVDLASAGLDAGTVKYVQSVIQGVRDDFGKAFDPYKQANRAYAGFTESVVDPLKQGPVGQLATPKGAKPDVQASAAKMETFFNQGVNSQAKGPSPILTLAKELKGVDPSAFPDAAKTVISNKLASINFAESPNPAAELNKAFFSDPSKHQALRDTMAGVADSFGLSRQEVVRGLDNLARISKAAANRPQSMGGLSDLEILQQGGKSQTANALRVFGFLPFERAARGIENFSFRRSAADFDRLLTSPEGAATLAKLGKMNPQDPRAIALLANFNAQAAQTAPTE